MKILDKAARLEKALLDRIGRRTDIARHPIELYRAILDDIEDASEPGARGTRIFPYTDVAVSIATSDPHQRATAEAVFAEPPSLEERVRTRLRQSGCKDAERVSVSYQLVDGAGDEWAERDSRIEFRRQPARSQKRPAKPRASEPRELHLVVLAGAAARARYTLSDARINLGRLADVLDRQQRIVRQNHVAFADADDDVSQSVSRTHAHIRFDAATGEARLYDDGSTHGTRVVRDGRTLDVPRGGRGLTLRDHDELVLGRARIRVTVKAAGRSTKRPSP